jgi:hypothetical protein
MSTTSLLLSMASRSESGLLYYVRLHPLVSLWTMFSVPVAVPAVGVRSPRCSVLASHLKLSAIRSFLGALSHLCEALDATYD